ncbi:hypothetical protein MPTK1_7g15920 [Marchantia polymorpha subsp. ruderalis]|uniref:Uncharacterized protein n=2 Tax=Marchantia polymorpha TaxID=3197 RepID=A0AAF6C049_MARPO|nr:hypothetical protein MARPO_0111s0027 [Marchantia polymorpha]BBN17633.1 hypothetical protein Mp_7g15920 [Marchantia polymorpha subsp. ruderalis]|eukprot:PTQ31468.1 hypothetical protein MARPO_0111s0027 [Marchantia polymorpha]
MLVMSKSAFRFKSAKNLSGNIGTNCIHPSLKNHHELHKNLITYAFFGSGMHAAIGWNHAWRVAFRILRDTFFNMGILSMIVRSLIRSPQLQRERHS